jgi:pimeloyl-ACP methyl ester carboxylesterase
MDVMRVNANGIDIAYETFGDPAAPPLVLVMGLGTQMLGWPDQFCRDLAAAGFYVVRFDNRDIGQSTHLDGLDVPNVIRVALRRRPPPYRIEDMATDTVAFLDALGLGPVHLVGASMGGFIAQTVALLAPHRVASLTLIMTSTGSRRVGLTRPRVVSAVLRRKPATNRRDAIAASAEMLRLIGSRSYPIEDEYVLDFAGLSYDRGYNPAGSQRQLAAVVAQSDRTRQLAQISVPTLVMHGLHDPLVSVSGGIAIARAIPGARFVGFNGMGHDLPIPLWPQFIAEIAEVTGRAG